MAAKLKSRLPAIAASMKPSVDAALRVGAQGIEQRAKERVPVDQGTLRDAIHTENDREGVFVVAGNEQVFYGHLIENGTVNQPPRPFLVPAAEDQRDVIVGLVAASLRRL